MKARQRLGLCVAICALIAMASAAMAADWAQWRGPRRDGISHETGWQARWPEGGPKRLWRSQVGRGLAAVAIVNGRLYTLGHQQGNDIVWCLDAETGEVAWKHAYPCKLRFQYPGPVATPTVDGDRVYTHSREGDLLCLGARSGEVIWSKNVRQEFKVPPQRPDYGNACSPLVLGRLLIVEVGAPDGLLVAFDKQSGNVVWRGSQGGQLSYSSPVAFELGGKQHVAAFHSFGLGVFDAASGKELWRYPWRTHDRCSVATPVVSGDRIFISASYGKGGALLKFRQAKPLWQTREIMSHHATCVLWKGFLYGFHYDRKKAATLRCLDFETGEVKWTKGGMGNGTALLADGKLIVLGQRGDLAVARASPSGFEPISTTKVLGGLCWTAPVLCDGLLYCRNHPGDLVCLDLRGKQQVGRADLHAER